MTMILQGGPFKAPVAGFRRFTVDEYHKLIQIGVLTENDRVELLEGFRVEKLPHDPRHDGTIQLVGDAFSHVLPAGWDVRVKMAVTLGESEPEPDLAVVRDEASGYMGRHPGPGDFGIVIEVSNTTLDSDRDDKSRIYAEAGLPVYWIVNLIDWRVEVYEQPSGPTADPGYGVSHAYTVGGAVPLVLGGQLIGSIPVSDLLP
ncbi:MAG: Uma2 family endonuclease [Gemmataceae bacterium]|nr:Uma2 family endonuclease [Gemmataceae bacterium]